MSTDDSVKVTLADSYKINEGQVLLTYGVLSRYICDDDWTLTEADVVCNQLGFDGAVEARSGGVFGEGDHFFLDGVNCTGDESNILYCSHDGFGVHDCKTGEVAGVVCRYSTYFAHVLLLVG